MKNKALIAAVLVALLGLLCISKADAREVEIPQGSISGINLSQYSPQQAKTLDDTLYYFWAIAHNQAEYERAAASRGTRILGSMTEQRTEFNTRTPGGDWYRSYGGDIRGRIDNTSRTRLYEQRTGGLPAWIYNPYAR